MKTSKINSFNLTTNEANMNTNEVLKIFGQNLHKARINAKLSLKVGWAYLPNEDKQKGTNEI